MILDDREEMDRLDLSKAIGFLESFPEQCEEGLDIGRKFAPKAGIRKAERIFVAGMGGSGIVGDLLAGLFPEKDIKVVKGYSLPEYAGAGDLVFAISHSGDTEETLAVFKEAAKRGCRIVAVTSGGEIERECFRLGLACIKVPKGSKPRFALGCMLFPVMAVLEKAGFIGEQNFPLAIKNLKETRDEIKTSVPAKDNLAKRIALKLVGTTPVVQGFGMYEPVAYRARTQFNENAKAVSLSETYPELNHNSILGWSGESGRDFSVIIIRDSGEGERIRRRIEFTKKLLRKSARSVIEVRSAYPYALSRALSTMYVLDFVTLYLGLLRGKDPGDDSLLSELKAILKQAD